MMTKVQELSEAEAASAQDGKIKELIADEINDDDYTDIGSEDSETEFESVHDESILERLAALVDIIPPVTRVKALQGLEDMGDWGLGALRFVGSGLWIISTASLLTLFPLALEMERENAVIDQEANRNPASQQESQKVILYDYNLNRLHLLLSLYLH
jgi:import receptor subunit TOM22